ncbi:uncharacterized protein Hap1MRO34_020761 [Clarias gariepinus]
MSAPDVESLQPVPRQRGRCLDCFLLGSVIALLVLVLLGGALGYWVVTDLRREMDERCPRAPQGLVSALKDGSGIGSISSSYKGQNFAYLTANDSELKDGNMFWTDIMYGSTSSIGSGYSYKSGEAFLTVRKDGPYFLYTQLNLTCIGVCTNGSVIITFYDEKSELLSCELDLSTPPYKPIVKNCYTVIPRLTNGTRITAKMQTELESVDGWKLDLNHSGFGMFLVDGP